MLSQDLFSNEQQHFIWEKMVERLYCKFIPTTINNHMLFLPERILTHYWQLLFILMRPFMVSGPRES